MAQDQIKDGFKSFGEFLVQVRRVCDGETKDGRLKTAGHLETGDDSQGGFVVPEIWADGIFHAALEDSIVRSRATVIKATSDSLKVGRVVDDDRSSGIFGGVTFTWTEEAGDKTDAKSKPAIGQLELNIHKLVGSVWVSNELEDDHGNFGGFMQSVFGRALRFIEDDSFLNGTGANQPLGIMNGGALITPARSGAGQVKYEDLTGMMSRLLPDSWNRAVWIINPDVVNEWLSADGVEAQVRNVIDVNEHMLLGFPFIVSEKAQTLGSQGDVILADFGAGHYVIADREIRIAASRHYQGKGTIVHPSTYGFTNDETFWKIVLRVDGQPLMTDPITPYRGANPLSPFIALADFTS